MASETDSNLWRYVKLVRSVPELERATELALVRRFKETGDEVARETLIRSHLRHVVGMAVRYRSYRAPLAELIAEGNHGLLRALDKFDPERGNRFMTYAAYWIRAYMFGAAIRSWSLVGGGSGALRSKLFFRLRRERVRVRNLHGEGDAAHELLAERVGVTPETLDDLLGQLDHNDVTLDAPVGNSSLRLIDVLPTLDPSQEELAVGRETGQHARAAVHTALATLDTRERYIAEHRLMADPEDEVSLAELGRRLGVSRERARQLETRVKRKLRTRILQHGQANGIELTEFGSAA